MLNLMAVPRALPPSVAAVSRCARLGFPVLQGLDLPVVGGIFPIASRRTKNADTKTTWSRRLRGQSVQTDEANRNGFFIGAMEVRENPSDICEKGLRSVQVSKKWNLEFPPTSTGHTPDLHASNALGDGSGAGTFSVLRKGSFRRRAEPARPTFKRAGGWATRPSDAPVVGRRFRRRARDQCHRPRLRRRPERLSGLQGAAGRGGARRRAAVERAIARHSGAGFAAGPPAGRIACRGPLC
jgi:hypothetical protein